MAGNRKQTPRELARAETEDAREIMELFNTLGWSVAPENVAELKRILDFDNVRVLYERMGGAETSRALRERSARQLGAFVGVAPKRNPRGLKKGRGNKGATHTDAKIIAAVREVHARTGARSRKAYEQDRDPARHPSHMTIYRRFGSWKAVQAAAGI